MRFGPPFNVWEGRHDRALEPEGAWRNMGAGKPAALPSWLQPPSRVPILPSRKTGCGSTASRPGPTLPG